MGDSTEEMLNVTIKRLEAIMVHFTPEGRQRSNT